MFHAIDVASEDPVDPIDRFYGRDTNQTVATVAAVAHDVGHLGISSTLISNTQEPLVVTDSDTIVLACCSSIHPMCNSFARVNGVVPITSRKQFVVLLSG